MGRYSQTIKIVIPDITPMSWNTFYRSHWTKQHQKKIEYQKWVWAYTPKIARHLYLTDCKILIRAYFKSKKRGSKHYWTDPDNICTKPLLDALKDGVIKDDDPQYIKSITLQSLLDAHNPRTEIIIKYNENNITTPPKAGKTN